MNYFERDNTSRPNKVLEDISVEADKMIRTATRLVAELQVNEARMASSLNRTNQMIMAQRLTFHLAEKLGKARVNDLMHEITKTGFEQGLTLREAFLASELAAELSAAELDALLDPQTYTGLAREQTLQIISDIREARTLDAQETTP
ncbi:MAG: hypothetical protein KDI36_19960 [Pseudomonadales bacterium]|nr:hypothetical protein [Pseudomonadales bacterium]